MQRFMCCLYAGGAKLLPKTIFDVELMKVPFATLFAFSIDQQKRDIKVASSNIVSCTLLDANNVTVRTINTTARLWFGMKEVRLNKEIVRISLTLSLLRVINVKIPLQPHKKYDITQYGELDFS